MKIKRCIALLLCLSMAAFGGTALAAPAGTQAQAETLAASMTVEQKLGQMLMPAFAGTTVTENVSEAIREYGFGGVILFSGNMSGTAGTTELICDLQSAAMAEDALTRLPLLVSTDQEGGTVYRLDTGTVMCGNMALGAIGDPAAARRSAAVIGSELAAEGFNVDFAPVMDVNINPSNPVIGIRSFSDDPTAVASLGRAFIDGLHSENVASALKHFPGHGDTVTDSHSGLPRIDKTMDELERCELIPFKACIDAGTDIIMTAHIQYPQIEEETYTSVSTGEEITLPATLSETIISELLRDRLGYEGVVCTDAMNMGAIAQHFRPLDAARLAINAGVDILLMPVNLYSREDVDECGAYIHALAEMVRSREISPEKVDAAAVRILKLKLDRGIMGLQIDKAAQVRNALTVVGSEANHEIEWELSTRAVTMVKNDNGALPVSVPAGGKVALFCAYSNEVNAMEYAVQRLRNEGSLAPETKCKVYCYQGMTKVSDELREAVRSADAVIADVETGSAANITGGWQSSFLDDLIELTHVQGKKITIISIQLPYDLARYQKADALLAAYCAKGMNTMPASFDGETAAYGPNLPAAVYTALGGTVPGGRLPVNIPKLDSLYRYSSEILYARGFGLTSWGFADVKPDSYCYLPVQWAVEQGITTGTSSTTFSPDKPCTRGQIVTFLWRAAGEPEPETAVNPFKDVAAKDYCYKAVLWAVEQGITTGTSSTTFSPDKPCTRGQGVTFLWRAADRPAVPGTGAFTDVSASSSCAEAVQWAVEQEITTGTSTTTFSPDKPCTRGQIVTFLYRWLAD